MKLEVFLKQNRIKKENVRFAVSENFCEDGKAVLWEIRCISAEEDISLREGCMKNVFDEGRRGMKAVFDGRTYGLKLCAASTVFPDLKSVELQESYGVMGEEKLLGKMLTSGEYERYLAKVQEVNGFLKSDTELKNEAKNL